MDPRAFYDAIADDYDLVYADWPAAVRRQAAALDAVIQAELGAGARRILDCTCGIGTQALGLAALGHDVVGTDLSARAIERARAEATRLAVPVRFEVADVRSLGDVVHDRFDVVLSADNSLPHLLTDTDLRAGARGMLSGLLPGGLFLASIRDYDRLVTEKPTSTPPATGGPPGARHIAFQLWRWAADGRSYELELFTLRELPDGWSVHSAQTRYRAIMREELSALLRAEGCRPRWLMPDESGYFQPLLAARLPGRIEADATG